MIQFCYKYKYDASGTRTIIFILIAKLGSRTIIFILIANLDQLFIRLKCNFTKVFPPTKRTDLQKEQVLLFFEH